MHSGVSSREKSPSLRCHRNSLVRKSLRRNGESCDGGTGDCMDDGKCVGEGSGPSSFSVWFSSSRRALGVRGHVEGPLVVNPGWHVLTQYPSGSKFFSDPSPLPLREKEKKNLSCGELMVPGVHYSILRKSDIPLTKVQIFQTNTVKVLFRP